MNESRQVIQVFWVLFVHRVVCENLFQKYTTVLYCRKTSLNITNYLFTNAFCFSLFVFQVCAIKIRFF